MGSSDTKNAGRKGSVSWLAAFREQTHESGLLPKLAGTASMFGDDRLNELASHLERALLGKPELSGDLLKECLPRLRRTS